MSMNLLKVMNALMHFAHLSFVIFCMIGWLLPYQWLYLAAMVGVLLSWFGLGIFFGFGYCFLTAIHWRIRRRLGIVDRTDSYVEWLVNRIGVYSFSKNTINQLTMILFFLGLFAGVGKTLIF